MLLNKRGHSNQSERILLLERLLSCLKKEQQRRIHYLLMDREFGSHDWITYLRSKQISFVIRIRKDANVRELGKATTRKAWTLFQSSEFKVLRKPRVIFGHRVFIADQQISYRENLILINNEPLKHGRQIYSERWGIEVFFGACKSRASILRILI